MCPDAARRALSAYRPFHAIEGRDPRLNSNSVRFISAFPNWDADHRGATFANADGVYLRDAWERFGFWAPDAAVTTSDGATTTGKDMADEEGHRPFAVFAERDGLADFDRVDPAYFRSLDRKLRHLSEQGFMPLRAGDERLGVEGASGPGAALRPAPLLLLHRPLGSGTTVPAGGARRRIRPRRAAVASLIY